MSARFNVRIVMFRRIIDPSASPAFGPSRFCARDTSVSDSFFFNALARATPPSSSMLL